MLVAIGLVGLLSGCVGFMGKVTGKQTDGSHVQVKFIACESTNTTGSNPNCPDRGNANNSSSGFNHWVLVGLRVSKGVRPPRSFSSTAGTSGTMVLDNDLTFELRAKAPADRDQKWFGYISTQPVAGSGTDFAQFKIELKVRRSFDGAKVKVRPTVGYQWSDPSDSRPIRCGANVFEGNGNSGRCIDSPLRNKMTSIKIPFERGR